MHWRSLQGITNFYPDNITCHGLNNSLTLLWQAALSKKQQIPAAEVNAILVYSPFKTAINSLQGYVSSENERKIRIQARVHN